MGGSPDPGMAAVSLLSRFRGKKIQKFGTFLLRMYFWVSLGGLPVLTLCLRLWSSAVFHELAVSTRFHSWPLRLYSLIDCSLWTIAFGCLWPYASSAPPPPPQLLTLNTALFLLQHCVSFCDWLPFLPTSAFSSSVM